MESRQNALAAVIIPNYNGLKYLKECMSALKKQTYTPFYVLIIDNGSTDGSAKFLKDEEENGAYPFDLKVICLPENTGFTGAVNLGIKEASDAEYAVLLNNDTEPGPGYLSNLLKPFGEPGGERIAAVTPKMVQLYHKELLDDAGDGYCVFGWAFQRGVGQKTSTKKFGKKTNVFSACGGACAYRRAVLEEIKFKGEKEDGDAYFDPLHFAYLEDIDVSFRLRIHGYGVLYAPDSVVYHVGSGTSGSKYNSFKVRLAARNNVYLNYKNLPLLMLLLNLPFIIMGIIVKEVFFIKLGFGKDYAAGFLEGVKTLGKCRSKKTAWKLKRTPAYVKLELLMIRDTFSYIRDFLARRLKRH